MMGRGKENKREKRAQRAHTKLGAWRSLAPNLV
jgi:hypothetical protein